MGDLGLMVSCVQSLQREFPSPEITILTQFAELDKPEGQTFDIAQHGANEIPWLCLPNRGPLRKVKGLVLLAKAVLYLKLLLVGRLLGKWSVSWAPSSWRVPVENLLDADLVISKPGGFIYGYGRVPGPHHLIHMLLASLSSAPLVIYGQSIGPFSKQTFVPLARFALNRAKLLLVRDEPSAEACRDFLRLPEEKLSWTGDEAFLLEPTDADVSLPERQGSGPLVGMTVINWAFPNCSDPATAREDYFKALAGFVDYLTEDQDATLVLLPFAQEQPGIAGDRGATNELVRRVRRPQRLNVCRLTDPCEIKRMQLGLDFFVGSRMHSNIFALGAGLPVLAIAYQPKTTGIMTMAGLGEFTIDIREVTADRLRELYQQMWPRRDELRQTVKRGVADLRQRASMNAKLSAQLVGVDSRSVTHISNAQKTELTSNSDSSQPQLDFAAK